LDDKNGYMVIEAAFVLPVILIILILLISVVLFFVIKTDTELEMYLDFASGNEDTADRIYYIDLPLLSPVRNRFLERNIEEDYGRHIQRSFIIKDVLRE
jgi:hypothetical protein